MKRTPIMYALTDLSRYGRVVGLLLLLSMSTWACGVAWAQQTVTVEPLAEPEPPPSGKGHGWVSIGYQNTYVNGLRKDPDTVLEAGNGRLRAAQFDLEYFFADQWSTHMGIAYVSNVFHGSPHCPTIEPPQCRNVSPLNPQHPESRFQDDGRYHGTWQDWSLGVAYHAAVGGTYLLTPSLTATVPSHDYTFFSNAAPGPGYWRVEAALELAHQFGFTNLYYRVGYGYTYTEHVFVTRMNSHRVDLELGYFINERLTLRAFAVGRKGQGFTIRELGPLTSRATNDYWYHHDQIVVHDFAEVGAGLDYRFGGAYIVSAALHKMIWGLSVSNFVYSAELRLTREF